MTTISLSPRLVTLINVFTVDPAHRQQLLEPLDFAEASLEADLNDEKISTFGLAMPLSD